MPPTNNPTTDAPAQAAAALDPDASDSGRTEQGSRQTLNLRARDAEKLEKLKAFVGGNANDAMRLALTIADVVRETTVNGGQISVSNSDGEQQVLKLLV